MIDLATKERNTWNKLRAVGYSEAGTAGLMASLFAESELRPNNLENGRETDLGSDTYYTSAVNNKTYSKEEFVNDAAGYGLAQWTYPSRKKGLYEATVEKGLSIADFEGQLNFLCDEVERYSNLDKFLRNVTDYNEAADAVLKDFERPAVLNYTTRRVYAKMYYDKYSKATKVESAVKDESKYETYIVKDNDSWWSIASDKLGSGIKMEELAEFNGKDLNTVLHPNDVIKLPILKQNVTDHTKKDFGSYYTNYTVKQNDSWWSIAENKLGDGTKMYKLAEFNSKNTTTMLHPGDILKIPASNVNNTLKYEIHTVKSSESWWSIAANKLGNGSRMNELANFNGKTVKTILHPGDVLKIPNK